MKRKLLPKSFYFIVAAVSLSAFLAVNLHAGLGISSTKPDPNIAQTRVEENDSRKDYDVPVPDVTVLGKIFALAEKLLPLAR